MKSLEQSADGSAAATAFDRIGVCGGQNALADVGISEAVEKVLAMTKAFKEFDVALACGVEAGVGSVVLSAGIAEALKVVEGFCGRFLDDGQRLKIACVGGVADLAVAMEVGDAFVHGTPDGGFFAAADSLSADFELPGVVDDGLDAEDQSAFVVHLDPVVSHAVFDSRAGDAIFSAFGEHLAVVMGIESSAEKAQDVGGLEVKHGVIEQAWVNLGQLGAGVEQEIGSVLGLIDDPVVLEVGQSIFEQGTDPSREAPQAFDPVFLNEAIGESLRLGRIIEFDEDVVLLDESAAGADQLSSQIVVPVDGDLDGPGKKDRKADVDQPQIAIEVVEVKDQARRARRSEVGTSFGVDEPEAGTVLQTAQDADQSLINGMFAEQVGDDPILAMRSGKIEVRPALALRQSLGMIDDALRLALGPGHEVLAADGQRSVNEASQAAHKAERAQVTLENDAIEAIERAEHVSGMLGNKDVVIHGVLLHLKANYVEAERLIISSPSLVPAKPA